MKRPPDEHAAAVREQAANCPDLDHLAERARNCVACADLAAARTQVVVGDLDGPARLLLVGEAPGAQEDLDGRPFVGKAGALLDELLAEAGMPRSQVAVANVLKCRPPGNRVPKRVEMHRCSGWLERQVELLDPSVVVTLGGTALAWALGPGRRLRDMRGRLLAWGPRQLIVTYHPSAAIRFGPAGEPLAALRSDLRLAAEATCAS